MEENITHLFDIILGVFLFVFALSGAVVSYSRMNYTAENMINVNIGNRQGTATSENVDNINISRETNYAEIALSALELNRTYAVTGMFYTIQVQRTSGNNYTISYESNLVRLDDNLYVIDGLIISANGKESKYGLTCTFYGTIDEYPDAKYETRSNFSLKAETDPYYFTTIYTMENETKRFIEDLKFFVGESSTYNISFTTETIIYEEV